MLIFNEAQALSYNTEFNYLGDVFNYNNSSTINIRGRLQSDRTYDNSLNSYFGIAYVDAQKNIYYNGFDMYYNGTGFTYNALSGSGGVAWVQLGGGEGLTTGIVLESSGNLYFEGGYAFVDVLGPNNLFAQPSGNQYSPLYDIWAGMDTIRSGFNDFQEIVINGVSVGSGRLTSLRFPESVDPRVSVYETEIQIYKTGNLYNLSGENYSNIQIDSDFCKYVSDLNESFDLKTNLDGTVSYDRSLSFNCIDPNISGGNYLINKVKNFASGIIFNDPAFNASFNEYPNFYEGEGSRYFSENYNEIRGSYSFSERFDGPSSGQSYKWTNSISVNLDSNGISTVSENGNVLGVRVPIFSSAYNGMSIVESSSLSRASEAYSNYIDGGGDCVGSLFLRQSTKTVNKEAGKIDYSFEYSNDPFSTSLMLVTRESQISRSEDGVFTMIENGSVKNLSSTLTNPQRLDGAFSHFKTEIKPYIGTRLYDIYESEAGTCGCDGPPSLDDIRFIETEETFSDFEGLFSYTYIYRSDCETAVDGFFVTIEKDKNSPVPNSFLGVTPYDGEISQSQKTNSLGNEKQTITVKSTDNSKTFDDYISAAIDNIDLPTSLSYFLSSADYTFDPDNSKLVFSVSYSFEGLKNYSDSSA